MNSIGAVLRMHWLPALSRTLKERTLSSYMRHHLSVCLYTLEYSLASKWLGKWAYEYVMLCEL